MQTEQIVALLVAERDRLSSAIDALQGPTKRRGRPGRKRAASNTDHHNMPDWVKPASAKTPGHRKPRISPEARARMAAGQRRRWAALKAASPVAAVKAPAHRKGVVWSAAKKKAQAERIKAFWAAKRKKSAKG